VNLPSAAVLTGMRIWGFDESTSSLNGSLIERCTPNDRSGSFLTSVIADQTSTGNAGNFTEVIAIAANKMIDNDACTYTLRTRYLTPGDGIFCAGTTLRLQKTPLNYQI